jgi:hypothetical protein
METTKRLCRLFMLTASYIKNNSGFLIHVSKMKPSKSWYFSPIDGKKAEYVRDETII